jgi:tol-pal system protein YbgF
MGVALRFSDYSYLILICLFFGGCAAFQGDIDILDRKLRRQNKEMKMVRQQQAELEARLDVLQGQLQRLTGTVEESKHYSQRASDDVISISEGLTSQVGKYERELNQLHDEIRTIKTLLGMKVTARKVASDVGDSGKLEQIRTSVPPTESLVKVTGTPDPEELYNGAYSRLSTGDFKTSREEFEKFLELFPQTEYSDNAQFWIGESYYREKRYEEAIIEFEEVIKRYPQGNKVPDAQLKQAFSFIALNDTNSAKLLLGKIITQYPDSDQAAIAQAKLKSLQ